MPTLNERVARLERQILGVVPQMPFKYLRLERIRVKVALANNLSVKTLCCKSRERRIAEARFQGYYLSRTFTAATHADIAKAFGAKDHGTVINGINRCRQLLSDPEFKKRLDTLERDLRTEFEAIN